MKNKDKKKPRHILVALLLGMLTALGFLFARIKPEQKKKLILRFENSGSRMYHTLIKYFIPHSVNGFKPHIFHKRSVKNILLFVIAVKVITVSTLFVLYPNQARLIQDIKGRMYELINSYRVETGVEPLEPNTYLEQVALNKANDMVQNNYFSHYGIDGRKPWEWIDTSVYGYTAMGENLAIDFLSAQSVLKAFQDSPSHDKNLINEKYTQIGISVSSGYLDGHDTNLMVVFFANPKTITSAAQLAQAEPVPVSEPTVVESIPDEPPSVSEQPINKPIGEQPEVNPVEPAPREAIPPEPMQEPEVNVKPIPDESGVAVLGEVSSVGQVDIASDNFSGGVVFSQGNLAQKINSWSNRFMSVTLLALILLLIINIVVKIKVQHAPVIINASLLIMIVTALLYVNVHQAEALGDKVRILSLFIGF